MTMDQEDVGLDIQQSRTGKVGEGWVQLGYAHSNFA